MSNNAADIANGFIKPTTAEETMQIAEMFKTSLNINDSTRVALVEVSFKSATDQERWDFFEDMFHKLDPKTISYIILWNSLRFDGDVSSTWDWGPNGLFMSDGSPTIHYYELMKAFFQGN